MRIQILSALAIALCAISAVADDASTSDQQKLRGRWELAEGELAGTAFPPEAVKGITLTVGDGTYHVDLASEGQTEDGKFELDAARSPKTMKITPAVGPNKGKTFLAIYEFRADSLRVCYDLSGKAYPTEFKTKPETELYLATYKKIKP